MRVWGFLAASVVAALLLAGSAGAGSNVVTCGSKITKPGTYTLKGDCSGKGITIETSDVTLSLRGHRMTSSPANTNAGIFFSEVSNVRILGPGTIQSYAYGIVFGDTVGTYVGNVTVRKNGNDGVNAAQSDNPTFDGTTAEKNGANGFTSGTTSGAFFRNVQANGNGVVGIELADTIDARVKGSAATGNGNTGIRVDNGSTANTIQNNSAFGNSGVDLFDGNADCDANPWTGNSFGSRNQNCIS